MSVRAGAVTVDGRRVGNITMSVLDGSDNEESFSTHSNVINASYHPDGGVGDSDRSYGTSPRGEKQRGGGSGQVHGGSYGGNSGGKSGANYLGSSRAAADGVGGKGLTTVETKAGKITVNKDAAGDMKNAVNELVDAGAPVGKIGSYANRNIAHSHRKSQHAYGGALDLFNQSGRGVISREGMAWIRANPGKWAEIKKRNNLVGGEDFGDLGHVEWGGPGYGERHYGGKGAPPSQNSSSGVSKGVKGSWFDDHITATKGVSAATTPGIALPTREGLGKLHTVTGPNGQTATLPQIDVGPAAWTGRGVDISAPALEKLGYDKKNFPTDAHFDVKPVGDVKDAAQKFGSGTFGYEQKDPTYVGTEAWKDMRRSDNIEDRRDPGPNWNRISEWRNSSNYGYSTVADGIETDPDNNPMSKALGIGALDPDESDL
jgi:hypothetical protein